MSPDPSNVPVSEQLDESQASLAQSILDANFSVSVDERGVFDSPIKGLGDRHDFAAHVERVISTHHGTFFHRYVARLSIWLRKKGDSGARAYVEAETAEFRKLIASKFGDGGNQRIVAIGGVMYAGVKLAHSLELLPATYAKPDYLVECYRRHVSIGAGLQTPMEKLIWLTRSEHRIDLGERQRYEGDPADLERKVIVRPNKDGEWEVIIHPVAWAFFFRNGEAALRDSAVEKKLWKDGRHRMRHRPITGRDDDKYYVFKLSQADLFSE